MDEPLPTIIARIGGLVLLAGLLLSYFGRNPRLWRRRPQRAHRIANIARWWNVGMAVAVLVLAVWAAASFPGEFAEAVGVLAIVLGWAVVMVLILAAVELGLQSIGRLLGRGTRHTGSDRRASEQTAPARPAASRGAA